jgi:hypothetical protein
VIKKLKYLIVTDRRKWSKQKVTPNFKKNIGQRLRKKEKMTEENKYINS